MKKIARRILKKFGLVVIKRKNLDRITTENKESKKLSHTIHLDFLMQLLKDVGYKPNIIFDIGANNGGWTASALEYFPNANYVLFEPQVNLVENINNRFSSQPNVKCYAVGVGHQKDVLQFTIHDRDDSCNFRMTEEEAAERGYKQIKVPVVAIDEFIEEQKLPFPDILKIDAEGIDLQVIKGALNSIKNHTEIVLVEVAIMNPKFENTALAVVETMNSLDFKLFDITDLNRPFKQQVLWLSEFVFIRKNGALDKNYSL
jgi:FkbM family methyltransferase